MPDALEQYQVEAPPEGRFVNSWCGDPAG